VTQTLLPKVLILKLLLIIAEHEMVSETEQEGQRNLRRSKVSKALNMVSRNIIKAIKRFWMALKLIYIELKYQLGGVPPQ
jgi:hypothetical protein